MMLFKHSLRNSSSLALIADVTDDVTHDGIGTAAVREMEYVTRAGGSRAFWALLSRALEDESISAVAVSLNRNCVFDDELLERLELACVRSSSVADWSVLAATGICQMRNVYSVAYSSAAPRLFQGNIPRPILDCGLELFILNAAFLREKSAQGPDVNMPPEHFPQWCILTGYLSGRLSMFRPELAIGVNGSELGRDPSKVATTLQIAFADRLPDDEVPSLMGSIRITPEVDSASSAQDRNPRNRLLTRALAPLADLVQQAAQPATTPMSLSVVTRTRFTRQHLLRRMLASLTRARQKSDLLFEVVLSTDTDDQQAREAHRILQAEFPELDLVLQLNRGQYPHSRVDNLVGGILAARKDYVVVVDDDDFVDLDAFVALSRVRFAGQDPLLVMSSQVRSEVWQETPTGRWILKSSAPEKTYHSYNVRKMFLGSNQLPVCAMVAPRAWLQARLDMLSLRHDLSEDYAIYLALLTAPDLPPLVVCDDVFCLISSRSDGSNTINMEDRRPWVRDITLFLHDLFVTNPVSGLGALQLLAQVARVPAIPAKRFIEATGDGDKSRQSREIAMLKAEVAYLRTLVVAMESPHCEGTQAPETAKVARTARKH